MRDSTRRALRTLAHGILAGLIAIPVMAAAFPTPDGRIAGIVATVVAICAAVTKVVNALEDAGMIPALFKAPASDGADPIPADGGYIRNALVIALVIIFAAVLLGFGVHPLFFLLLILLVLILL